MAIVIDQESIIHFWHKFFIAVSIFSHVLETLITHYENIHITLQAILCFCFTIQIFQDEIVTREMDHDTSSIALYLVPPPSPSSTLALPTSQVQRCTSEQVISPSGNSVPRSHSHQSQLPKLQGSISRNKVLQ